MSKITKILLGVMAVSLVPLGMLGAMLYFGSKADTPAGGTIDSGNATGVYESTAPTYQNVSNGTFDGPTDSTEGGAGNIDNKYDSDFYVSDIPSSVWKNMQGKSYAEGCPVEKNELRYVHVLYVDFAGRTCDGELIVNKLIADDVLDIFRQLYEAEYPIEKIALIDEYDGDDELSMSDNNTSAFNFRTIAGTDTVSKHGMGLAVDVNPFYNPQVKETGNGIKVSPEDAISYADRDVDFLYKIDHDDLCYKLFTEHGFEWGGDWETAKDYQHFEYSQ